MKAPAVIARKFQVERFIGGGGMGNVYLAREPRLGNRPVAIKLLRVDSEEARHRFEREAAAAANLIHRNIVIIYEYGDHEGQPYIAMEFIEGDALGTIVAQERPLTIARKLELLDDLCAGLGFAHKQRIVHRDVKPGNLLVNRDGCLKIVDFGIARAQTGSVLTVGTIGTPNYMSPEQVNGDTIDHRSDIFAVGLVAYELISYRMAFPGASGRVYDAIRYLEPEPLETVVNHCDPRLAAIVRRAIAKRPDDRYQRLDDMRADLDAIRKSTSDDSKPMRGDTVVQRRATTPQPLADRAALQRRRQRMIEEHVDAGRKALDAGDLETAIDRFEQAAALDDQNTEALDLLEQARRRQIDGQILDLLKQADEQVAATHWTEAALFIDQALALRPDDARATALSVTVEQGRTLQRALETARRHTDAQAWDAALRAASDVLALDPGNAEALELTQRALDAIAETQRQKRRRQQAQDTIARARDLVSQKRLRQALELLKAFNPADAGVTQVMTELQAKFDAMKQRLDRASEQVTHALEAHDFVGAEAVAAAVERDLGTDDEVVAFRHSVNDWLGFWLAKVKNLAQAKSDAGDLDGALALIQPCLAVAPDLQPWVDALTREHELRQARDDAERERIQREQAERERAERDRLVRERAERERAERERARLEHERLERARLERERVQREQAERAQAERERARAEALAAAPPETATAPETEAWKPEPPTAGSVGPATVVVPRPVPPRRGTGRYAAMAGAGLIVVLAIIYVATRRSEPPPPGGEPGALTADIELPKQIVEVSPLPPPPPPDPKPVQAKPDPVTPPPADPRLALMRDAFNQRRYEKAIALAEAMLKDRPGDKVAAQFLTGARRSRNMQLAAVTPLIARGDTLRRDKAYGPAIDAYQSALDEDPDNADATTKLAQTREAKRVADEAAKKLLEQPQPVADNGPAQMRQANALLETGLVDEAIALFDQVLKTHPGAADATAGRARALALKNAARLQGEWTGAMTFTAAAGRVRQPLTMTLTQDGATVSGTWRTTGGIYPKSGRVTGTVTGTSFSGTVTVDMRDQDGRPSCSGALQVTGSGTASALTWNAPDIGSGNCLRDPLSNIVIAVAR